MKLIPSLCVGGPSQRSVKSCRISTLACWIMKSTRLFIEAFKPFYGREIIVTAFVWLIFVTIEIIIIPRLFLTVFMATILTILSMMAFNQRLIELLVWKMWVFMILMLLLLVIVVAYHSLTHHLSIPLLIRRIHGLLKLTLLIISVPMMTLIFMRVTINLYLWILLIFNIGRRRRLKTLLTDTRKMWWDAFFMILEVLFRLVFISIVERWRYLVPRV